MLTKGDLQSEELTRLRKQFEAYVKQNYDIQELTARHEIELRKYQSKVSELLQTISQVQDKNRELRQTVSQKNSYIESLEKSSEEHLLSIGQMQKSLNQVKDERDKLQHQVSSSSAVR